MEPNRGGIPQESEKQSTRDKAILLRRVADEYIDCIRLIPTDGGKVAMWVINPQSGTVIAVDETGRGGTSDGLSDDLPGYSEEAQNAHLKILATLGFLLFIASTACDLKEAKMSPSLAMACMGVALTAIVVTTGGILEDLRLKTNWPTIISLAKDIRGFHYLRHIATRGAYKIPLKNALDKFGIDNPWKIVVVNCILQYSDFILDGVYSLATSSSAPLDGMTVKLFS